MPLPPLPPPPPPPPLHRLPAPPSRPHPPLPGHAISTSAASRSNHPIQNNNNEESTAPFSSPAPASPQQMNHASSIHDDQRQQQQQQNHQQQQQTMSFNNTNLVSTRPPFPPQQQQTPASSSYSSSSSSSSLLQNPPLTLQQQQQQPSPPLPSSSAATPMTTFANHSNSNRSLPSNNYYHHPTGSSTNSIVSSSSSSPMIKPPPPPVSSSSSSSAQQTSALFQPSQPQQQQLPVPFSTITHSLAPPPPPPLVRPPPPPSPLAQNHHVVTNHTMPSLTGGSVSSQSQPPQQQHQQQQQQQPQTYATTTYHNNYNNNNNNNNGNPVNQTFNATQLPPTTPSIKPAIPPYASSTSSSTLPASSGPSQPLYHQPPPPPPTTANRYITTPMRSTASALPPLQQSFSSSIITGTTPPIPSSSSSSSLPRIATSTVATQQPPSPFHLQPPPMALASSSMPFPSQPPPSSQFPKPSSASTLAQPPQPQQQPQTLLPPSEPRPKIDPSQIPRPPLFTRPQNGQPLPMYPPKSAILSFTDLAGVKFPPPADSRFVVKEDGNASPHLIRSVFQAIPTNRGVLRQVTQHADLFGILCSPCALGSASTRHRPRTWPPSPSSQLPPVQLSLFQQGDDPQSIPLCINASTSIDDDSSNPPRCSHCQAYANPFFGSSSEHLVCNFCQFTIDRSVSERISWFQGALEFGTVEYPVGGDYITRTTSSSATATVDGEPSSSQALASPVAPPIVLYAIDVTCPYFSEYGNILTKVGLELAEHYARQEHAHDNAEPEPQQQQQQHVEATTSAWKKRSHHYHASGKTTFAASSKPPRPLPRMGICLVSATGIVVLQLQDPNQTDQPSSWTVMSDVIDEPFCPLPVTEWTWELTPKDDEHDEQDEDDDDHWTDRLKWTWESVVEGLEEWLNQKTPYPEYPKVYQATCGGAAMAMMVDALQETGGRATWISWRRSNFGVGSLRDRERDMKVQECDLYTPLQGKKLRMQAPEQIASQFYQQLGEQCAKHQIVMDVILHTNPQLPRSFLGVATLAELCRTSTGRLSWITTSNGTNWEESMFEELCLNAVACCGYDAVFKVRCSNGLEVKSFVASNPGVIVDRGVVVTSPELELASVSPQTCIAVLLDHRVGGLPKSRASSSSTPPCVYIQTALLYTNILGHRRLRISTLALRTSSNPADIFRSTDFGTMTAFLMRHAVERLQKEPDEEGRDVRRAQARQNLVDRCVDLLIKYRLNTTARSAPLGQLILPDKLQLLPLFVMSLIKSPILRPSLRSGHSTLTQPDPTGDERALAMFYGAKSTPAMAMLLVHANIFPLSKLQDGAGDWQFPAGAEYTKSDLHRAAHHPYVQLPASVHPSISCLDEDEIYLMDNGLQIFLHVGRGASPAFKKSLLSNDDQNGSRRPHHKSLSTSSALGQQVHRLIWQMRLFSSPAVATESQMLRLNWPPVIIVESSNDETGSASLRWEESKVLNLMVDDAMGNEKDYVDFLCELHRLIKQKFEKEVK